jgi:outer membrane protein OmpA-like peptidoglycan-associated protein
MTMKIKLAVAFAGTLALTACIPADEPGAKAQRGVVTGAIAGGLLGATAGGNNDRLARTAIGAGVGAIAGGLIGSALDRQAAELRGQVGNNVQIINEGNQLRVVMPQDILFATDSATLQSTLIQDLRAVSQSLLDYPNSTIQVIGHTDNVGAAAYNQELSQRRANSVANVLRDYGVPGGRVVAFGRGEDAPVASNLTPEGRSQNRRVEIIIRPNA